MSVLIIEIPHASLTAQTPLRYVLSADGQVAQQQGTAVAALLPKPGRTDTVTLVLAPHALSWHRVALPKIAMRDRQRVRAVLQGLLEDQLLDDGAQLHMALEPNAAAGQSVWVSVCQKGWLQQALDVLAQHGIQAHRIAPAFAPEALAEDQARTPELTAFGTESDAWLAITHAGSEGQALVVPLSPAITQLDVVANSSPQTLVYAEPGVYALAGQILGRPVQLLELADYLLAAGRTRWNLAQFHFANTGRDRLAQGVSGGLQALLRGPRWRWVRWGAALLVLVQLVGINIWAWQAKQQLQAKRAEVQAIFRTTFPKIPVVVDAPLQMQREVARMQEQSGALTHTAFEVLAAAAGAALEQAAAQEVPMALRYDGQSLRLEGVTLNDDALARMQGILQTDLLQALPEGDSVLVVRPSSTARQAS